MHCSDTLFLAAEKKSYTDSTVFSKYRGRAMPQHYSKYLNRIFIWEKNLRHARGLKPFFSFTQTGSLWIYKRY